MKRALYQLPRRTILPNSTSCSKADGTPGKCQTCGSKGCGYFHVELPAVAQAAAENGYDLNWIRQIGNCRCGFIRREQDGYHQRMRVTANLPHEQEQHRSFDNFEARKGTEEALKASKGFCSGSGANILVLLGNPGSGKTHLLEAIGRYYLGLGVPLRYDTASTIFDQFRAASSGMTEVTPSSLMEWYDFPLLLIDELPERSTEYSAELITQLVEKRLSFGGRLALAMNMDYDDVEARYGLRLASRLWTSNELQVRRITMTCTDYRTKG